MSHIDLMVALEIAKIRAGKRGSSSFLGSVSAFLAETEASLKRAGALHSNIRANILLKQDDELTPLRLDTQEKSTIRKTRKFERKAMKAEVARLVKEQIAASLTTPKE